MSFTTSTVGSDPPSDRYRMTVLVAVAAGVTAVVFSILVVLLPAGFAVWRDLVAYNLVFAFAATACLLRARCRTGRVEWSLMGVALLLNLAANIYDSLVLRLDPDPLFPSWADAGYLAYFPLLYVGLLVMLRRRLGRGHASVWLDGLVAALGIAAVAVEGLAPTLVGLTDGAWNVALTNLSYPVGDVLLLSVVVAGVGMLAPRVGATWWLLAAGLLCFTLADTIYAFQGTAGTYRDGTFADVPWVAGPALIAAAAARSHRPGPPSAPRAEGLAVLALPTTFAAGCLVLLAARPTPVVAVLASGAVAVALVRLLLSFRELRQLADARRQAATDDLTGLANRRAFTTGAAGLLKGPLTGPEGSASAGLLLLDLDRFKEVNDSLGHAAGDELLVELGERIAGCLRGGSDLLARLGGDEFAVLLPGANRVGAERTSARICAALDDPFVLDGVTVHSSASIGIALFPEHGSDLPMLLRRADIAMYRAKTRHLGHTVFSAETGDHEDEDRLPRQQELRAGIARGELIVHYQPKLELCSGRVVGAEALVRWDHPTRGLLTPDAFLSLAQNAGLMSELTATVLDQALNRLAAWHRAGLLHSVSVNLPPSAVVDAALPRTIETALNSHGLPGRCLILEITEDFLLGDRTRARDVLAQLRAAGVRISIDDYGSGYSSLAYLRELPVDELKLDRTFVTPMVGHPRSEAIVASTISLAHSLGLTLVAEGIEDELTAEALARHGCDQGQGYHISRPLCATDFEGWVRGRDLRLADPRAESSTSAPVRTVAA